eukprot:Gb_22073 [translate_table: standard]
MMGCFSIFFKKRQKGTREEEAKVSPLQSLPNCHVLKGNPGSESKPQKHNESFMAAANQSTAQVFSFQELSSATKSFSAECLLGEGGFGRVYKGRLGSTGQVVAVKQLDKSSVQGDREFLVEVLMLSLFHHPNLVDLIGYCADGDQRLVVYEYMPLGCLEGHLHGKISSSPCLSISAACLHVIDLTPGKQPLDWSTRMKIAAGAARGLEYLHDKANPPVIYRDLKSSNILLDEGYHPKLSDFGLAKLGPVGDNTHVSTRVMGTYGYCAPEYAMTGQLTTKSDMYSFGVVLLEMITGRKVIDTSRAAGEHNLVAWARPLFKDKRKFPQMADPMLKSNYPPKSLCQALAIAAMCLRENAASRPHISEVVIALDYLASQTNDPTRSKLSTSWKKEETETRLLTDRQQNVCEVGHGELGSTSLGEKLSFPSKRPYFWGKLERNKREVLTGNF